ncbi:MAG: hypothetical protein ACYSUI_24220, partial [Planctomycetota bacterium]
MNGRSVGTQTARGKLKSVGAQGFLVGVGADRRRFQLKGRVNHLSIQEGAVAAGVIQARHQKALQLQQNLIQRLNLDRIRVEPSRDESYVRLQPVKSILSAVGVENLTDLGTLQVPDNTVITPGKVMIAPRQVTPPVTVAWADLATRLRAGTVATKRTILAKHLPNRNSSKTLRAAIGRCTTSATRTTVAARTRSTIAVGERPTDGLAAATTLLRNVTSLGPRVAATTQPLDRAAAVLASHRRSVDLAHAINLTSDRLKVRDVKLVDHLEGARPNVWPKIGTTQLFFMNTFVLPVDASVIIANTVDLRDVEMRIEPEVAKLYIIAEEIKVNANSNITWRQPGGSTPPRADDPDLNGRGYSGQHLKPESYDGLDGEDGRNGGAGTAGAGGRSAPALEIWT